MSATPADKKVLRQGIRANRAALGTEERNARAQQHAQTVISFLRNLEATGTPRGPVGLYVSAPDEPDSIVVATQLHDLGYKVYVPVCEPEYQLSWVQWYPGVEVARSRYAPIDEPVGVRFGVELFEDVSLLCIPALAIARDGIRLGQGGGYYDRFLPKIPDTTLVGAMVYEEEILDTGTIPVSEYDMAVDVVFTPSQVIRMDR